MSLQQSGVDPETGKLDSGVQEGYESLTKKQRRTLVYDLIKELGEESNNEMNLVHIDMLTEELEDYDITDKQLQEQIDNLYNKEGILSKPNRSEQFYKAVGG